eukprot:scaffold540553_cov34-Prasinocladus_malaysianus.AAC.1
MHKQTSTHSTSDSASRRRGQLRALGYGTVAVTKQMISTGAAAGYIIAVVRVPLQRLLPYYTRSLQIIVLVHVRERSLESKFAGCSAILEADVSIPGSGLPVRRQ